MITEHTDTTTTTPQRGTAAVSRRSITNTAPQPTRHTPDPCGKRKPSGCLRHLFLRCSRPLYSSQTTTRTPHTLVGAAPQPGNHDHRQDAGNPDTTPPPPPKGTGPVVSGPNSAPRTTPTTGPVLFHHPHRRNPTGSTTVGQVLGPDPAGNPHTRRIGTREAQEECGHLLVDIPPMSSPHQHHGRALGRGRPPHGGQRLLRKEVIQPHLPVRLPCYDLVPIASPTFDGSLPQGVRPPASGVTNFRDLTGGVYKARERIHRSVADLRLLATPTSWGRVADPNPN